MSIRQFVNLLIRQFVNLLIRLRFPQLLYDCPDLSWGEGFAGGGVAHRLQLLPQGGAAVYPCHEVIDRRARHTVREIHQRQLLLGVCANSEIVLHNL